MLYVLHVYLTKAKAIHKRQTHPIVREDVAQGLWPQGFACKKLVSDRVSRAWRHEELIGSKLSS
jgi:hypothetical protein